MEQLNIEGKRSGEGFVTHKARLVSALSRALADRIMLLDLTIGRKGLLNYLKALGGSNIVKVVPSNGSASVSQAIGKRLKVVCGNNTSYLAEGDFIGEKTPLTIADVRVMPNNTVTPNIGTIELADALTRVLPFTAKDENRPVLGCVNFVAKEGKLKLVSADGFRLAEVSLDYGDGEGQALVNGSDLKGMVNALKRAKRARISFESGGERLDSKSLILDTELIRYKWSSLDGNYPDYEKLIPTEFTTFAHFDTAEALKAVSSLKALADSKSYSIDVSLDNGYMVMANTDDKGQSAIPADIEGNPIKVRIDGGYLKEALRACGGMVELKLTSPQSPMLFVAPDYRLVQMPMAIPDTKPKAEATAKQAEAKAQGQAEAVAQAEPKARVRRKGKGKGKGEQPHTEAVAEGQAVAEAEAVAEAKEQAETVAVA